MHLHNRQKSSYRLCFAATVTLGYSTLAAGQFFEHPDFGAGDSSNDDNNDSDNSNGSGGTDFGTGSLEGYGPGFDVELAMRYRVIHGILASAAFIVLFPLGSILIRILPGRWAIWAHGITQVFSYVVYVAAAALGFWLVQEVRLPPRGETLLGNPFVNYHPILGIVVLIALFIQPFLGVIHHARFIELRRRQIWSYLHIWNGRIAIPVGIINGGIGLKLAGASTETKLAYAVIAAVMMFIWITVAIFFECRRSLSKQRQLRSPSRRRAGARSRRSKMSDGSEMASLSR